MFTSYDKVSSQVCSVRSGSLRYSVIGAYNITYSTHTHFVVTPRFPLELVFRIYDNCLASGIEAIFGFGIVLLHKNEDALLGLKFDEILEFLNNRLLERYKVCIVYCFLHTILLNSSNVGCSPWQERHV
jgi:hypothetical protein